MNARLAVLDHDESAQDRGEMMQTHPEQDLHASPGYRSDRWDFFTAITDPALAVMLPDYAVGPVASVAVNLRHQGKEYAFPNCAEAALLNFLVLLFAGPGGVCYVPDNFFKLGDKLNREFKVFFEGSPDGVGVFKGNESPEKRRRTSEFSQTKTHTEWSRLLY